MNILFICGSLEPGRDGVGDYTDRLAKAIRKRGHHVLIIGINDRHIKYISDEFREFENYQIPVYRIPSCFSSAVRFSLAKNRLEKFGPEWVSLQYVPFSFHKKGLPLNFGLKFSKLVSDFKCHVMFHELWIGMEREASLKVILWGIFQKTLVQSLLKRLKPKLINTQTELYQIQLKKLGFQARLLPLFSNIPIYSQPIFSSDFTGLNRVTNNRIIITVFGSIQKGSPIIDFAGELSDFSIVENIPVLVLFIGKSGYEIKHWVEVLCNKGIEVEIIGEISPTEISDKLSLSSIGISTTPLAQIEKSGTVAAMREHGLNVLVVARSWNPRGIDDNVKIPPGVAEYKRGSLSKGFILEKKDFKINKVDEIARNLIDSFQRYGE